MPNIWGVISLIAIGISLIKRVLISHGFLKKEGEEGFRDRETRALQELTALPNIIMATGGGAVGRTKNRELLKKKAW